MKKSYLLPILLLICFAACKNEKKIEAITEMSKTFAFSDTLKLDTFKVTLTGEKSADMVLKFTINNFKGKEIYQKTITATELLKSYLDSEDLKKENDKIAFINKQINAFFTEEHFLEPAVTEEQDLDENTPDEAFYNELKQTQLNGFYFSLGVKTKAFISLGLLKNKK